jgi:antitoxin VapB
LQTTRVFKPGNSQAVRIPAELAYADTSQQLTTTRMGDVITIYPARRSMAEMVAKLRAMPKPPPINLVELERGVQKVRRMPGCGRNAWRGGRAPEE